MRIIKTNDGLIGLDFHKDCDVIWCHSIEEALPIMSANFQHLGQEAAPSKKELERDVRYAIDHLAHTGDDVAMFGTFGTFLFTTKEDTDV